MKMEMKRLSWLAFSFFVLPLVITACSAEKSGVAEPKTSESVDDAAVATSSPMVNSDSIDPCKILSSQDLAKYGEFQSEYEEVGSARSCFWQRSAKGNQEVSTFSLNVRDSNGLDAVNDVGGGIVEGEVNGRRAAVAKNPRSGSCTVALEINDGSRIDVTITTSPDQGMEECQFGQEIAYLVEPRLPDVPS